jgi:hypothetical protein
MKDCNSYNHGMHRIGNKGACLPVMPIVIREKPLKDKTTANAGSGKQYQYPWITGRAMPSGLV